MAHDIGFDAAEIIKVTDDTATDRGLLARHEGSAAARNILCQERVVIAAFSKEAAIQLDVDAPVAAPVLAKVERWAQSCCPWFDGFHAASCLTAPGRDQLPVHSRC